MCQKSVNYNIVAHSVYLYTSALDAFRGSRRKGVPLRRASRHVGIDISSILLLARHSIFLHDSDCDQPLLMRSKRLEKEYGNNDERYLYRSPSVALDNPNWFNVAATECLSVFLGTIPQQSQIAHKVWKV